MTRQRDKTWSECLSANQFNRNDNINWECAKKCSKQRECKKKDACAIVEIFLSKKYIKEKTVKLRKSNRDESKGKKRYDTLETRHFTQNVRFDSKDRSLKRDPVKVTDSSAQVGTSAKGHQLDSIRKTSQKSTSPETNLSSARSKMEVPRNGSSRKRLREQLKLQESEDSFEQYVTNDIAELGPISSLGATADDAGKKKRGTGRSRNAEIQREQKTCPRRDEKPRSQASPRTGEDSREVGHDRLSSTSMELDEGKHSTHFPHKYLPVSYHSHGKTVKSRETIKSKSGDTHVFQFSERRSRTQSHHKSILYDSANSHQAMEDSLGRILSHSQPNSLSGSSDVTGWTNLKFVKPNVIDDSTYALPEDDPTQDFMIIPCCHRKGGDDFNAPTRKEDCLYKEIKKTVRSFGSPKEIQKGFVEKSRVVLEDALSQESRTNGSLPRVVRVKAGDAEVNQDPTANSRPNSAKDRNEAKHIPSASRMPESATEARANAKNHSDSNELSKRESQTKHDSKQRQHAGQPQNEPMKGLDKRSSRSPKRCSSQSEVKEIFRRNYSRSTLHGNVSKSRIISYSKSITKQSAQSRDQWEPEHGFGKPNRMPPGFASKARIYENKQNSPPSKGPAGDQAQNQGSLQSTELPPQENRDPLPKVNPRRVEASPLNKHVSSQTLEFRQHERRRSESGTEKQDSSDRSGNGAGFSKGSKFESRRPGELKDLQSVQRPGSKKREPTRSETMENSRPPRSTPRKDTPYNYNPHLQSAQELKSRSQKDRKSHICPLKLVLEPPEDEKGTSYQVNSELEQQTPSQLFPETERNCPTDRRVEYPSGTGAESREMDSKPIKSETDPRQKSGPKRERNEGLDTTETIPQGTSSKCKSRLSPQPLPSDRDDHRFVVCDPWTIPSLPEDTRKASQFVRNTNCGDQLDQEVTENLSQRSSSNRESMLSPTWRSHEFQTREEVRRHLGCQDIGQSSAPPRLHDEARKPSSPSDPRAMEHEEWRSSTGHSPRRGALKHNLNQSPRRESPPLPAAGVDGLKAAVSSATKDNAKNGETSETRGMQYPSNGSESNQKSTTDWPPAMGQGQQRDYLKEGPKIPVSISSLSDPQESGKGIPGQFKNSEPRMNSSNSRRTTDPSHLRPADEYRHSEEELKKNGESPTSWKHNSHLSPQSPHRQQHSWQRVRRHPIPLLEPHVSFAEKTSVSSDAGNKSDDTRWREECGEDGEYVELLASSNRLPEFRRITFASQTLTTGHEATCNKEDSNRKFESAPMENELDPTRRVPTSSKRKLHSSSTSSPYLHKPGGMQKHSESLTDLTKDLSKEFNKPHFRLTCNRKQEHLATHKSERGPGNDESIPSIPSLHGLDTSEDFKRDLFETNENHGFRDFETIFSPASKRGHIPGLRNEYDFQLKLHESLPAETLNYPPEPDEICQKKPGESRDREHMSSEGFPSNTDQANSMQVKPLVAPPLHTDQSHDPLKLGEVNSSQNKKMTSICEAQGVGPNEEPNAPSLYTKLDRDEFCSLPHSMPSLLDSNELKISDKQMNQPLRRAELSSAAANVSERAPISIESYERNNSFLCKRDPAMELLTDPSLDGSHGDQDEIHVIHNQVSESKPELADTQSGKFENDPSHSGDVSRDISQAGIAFTVITSDTKDEEASKSNQRPHELDSVGNGMRKDSASPTPSVVKMEHTASLNPTPPSAPLNRGKVYLSDSLGEQRNSQGVDSELQNFALYLQNRLKDCEKKVEEQLAIAAQNHKDRRRAYQEVKTEEELEEEIEEFHSDECEAEVYNCREKRSAELDGESVMSDNSDIPPFQGCDCMRECYYKIMRLAYNK